MDGNEIGLPQQRVERDGRHAELAVERVVVTDVVREDARAESRAQTRHVLADAATPNDADRRRRELPSAWLTPGALAHLARERHDAATEREHETDRELRDRLTVHARRP